MPGFDLLAEEHVKRSYCTALRREGYDVSPPGTGYESGIDDIDLIAKAVESTRVLLTNDSDFAQLGDELDHPGILIYADQALGPDALVQSLVRVDRYLTPRDLRNEVEWLAHWR